MIRLPRYRGANPFKIVNFCLYRQQSFVSFRECIVKRFFDFCISLSIIAAAQVLLWLALFSTPLLGATILFYRGIGLMLLSTIIIGGLLLVAAFVRNKKGPLKGNALFTLESVFSGLVSGASVAICFFIVVPVTLDRSVTTFLLSRMAIHSSLSKEQIHNVLVSQYIDEYDAVGRRMAEQIASGNVTEVSENSYALTQNGRNFLKFSGYVADIFRVQKKFIQAEAVKQDIDRGTAK